MEGLAQGAPAVQAARPTHAAPSLQLPGSRDDRVMAGLQREAAAIEVLDGIAAQANVLGPVARGRWDRDRQRDGGPGDVPRAEPQEKGTERTWRRGGEGGHSEKQAVKRLGCVSVCLCVGGRGTTHRKVSIQRVSDRQALSLR